MCLVCVNILDIKIKSQRFETQWRNIRRNYISQVSLHSPPPTSTTLLQATQLWESYKCIQWVFIVEKMRFPPVETMLETKILTGWRKIIIKKKDLGESSRDVTFPEVRTVAVRGADCETSRYFTLSYIIYGDLGRVRDFYFSPNNFNNWAKRTVIA